MMYKSYLFYFLSANLLLVSFMVTTFVQIIKIVVVVTSSRQSHCSAIYMYMYATGKKICTTQMQKIF